MRKLPIIWFLLLFISIISCTSKSGNSPSLKKGSTVSGKVIAIINGDGSSQKVRGNKNLCIYF